jgi:hypothetical protein
MRLPGPEHELWGDRGDAYLELQTRLSTGEQGPVVFDWRDGSTVYVRLLDPGEEFKERVRVLPGDEVVTQTPIAATAFNLTNEVGRRNDLVVWLPVKFVRREQGKVIARLLGRGEHDDRRRVQVPPGWKLEVENVRLTLAQIDERLKPADERGYSPATDSLWAWLVLTHKLDSDAGRYLLAAARRLDAAHRRHLTVERLRSEVAASDDQAYGPHLRRNTFELIGEVEGLVIALHRALDMIVHAKQIARGFTASRIVEATFPPLSELRHAYEHINERAFGLVKRKKHPDALTVFDWGAIFSDVPRVTYARHEVRIGESIDVLLGTARRDLMAIANVVVGDEVVSTPAQTR